MRTLVVLVFTAALGLGLGLAACGKDKPAGEKKADPHAGHMHAMDGMHGAGGPVVTVPKEGKKFEPPIQVSQVPEGAWYCDMGTVEYARGDKGDGRCPICRMRLKQKVAEKK